MKATRILNLLLSLLFCAFFASAQNPKSASEPAPILPPQLQADLVTLRNAALGNDYAYQQVAHLTDNIGPRAVGSRQAEAAVRYVADELRKLGLEVRLEDVQVPHWTRGLESAELVQYPGQEPGTYQKIVVTALGGNTPTPEAGLLGEIVVVNDFEELKALGRPKIAGKIVLFNVRFDQREADAGFALEAYEQAVQYRGRGAKAAADLGAVASLVRTVGGANFRLPHTGWSMAAGIPAGAVTSEDAGLIARLAAQGTVRMHLVLTSQNGPPVLSHNVIADLKGSEHPEQIVIVSGHLDSWDLGTGAIDDAAGVAVAMEAAQLIQQLHLHPRRTIRVIAWMDEENSGKGHDVYAQEHQSEFPNHVGAIESDLGAGHAMGFRVRISDAALRQLKPVQEVLSSFGASVLQQTNEGTGSDIEPLSKAGVPAFGILQDGRTYFHYHHSPADTLDKIAPQELRENAAAMAVMGYALANLPNPLPR